MGLMVFCNESGFSLVNRNSSLNSTFPCFEFVEEFLEEFDDIVSLTIYLQQMLKELSGHSCKYSTNSLFNVEAFSFMLF